MYTKFQHNVRMIGRSKFRCGLAYFRSCAHLVIEEGWYIGLIPEHRTCPYCEFCVEDECHFMLECPFYANIRQNFLPNVNHNNLLMNVFYILIASDNLNIIKNTAMYISPSPITRTVTQMFPVKIVPEHLPLLFSGCKYGTKR